MRSLIFRQSLSLLSLAALGASTAVPNDAAVAPRTNGGGTPPPCSTVVEIQNADFETGSLSPWMLLDLETSPNSTVTIASPGDGDGYAVQLSVAPENNYPADASVYQTIPLCPATNYSITFDYKVVSADKSCRLTASMQSSYSNFANVGSSDSFHTVGDWNTATFYYANFVKLEAFLSATFECDTAERAAVGLVDNFKIEVVGSLEPDGCPDSRQPVIGNGGFETGELAPWTFYKNQPKFNYSIVSPGYAGSNYALEIEIPVGLSYVAVEQTTPGSVCLAYNYTLSFAANWGSYSFASNKPIDGCRVSASPSLCSSRTGSGPYYYPPSTPNSGWQQYTYSCIPTNSVALSYYVQLECRSEVGQPYTPAFNFQLDDFTIARAT